MAGAEKSLSSSRAVRRRGAIRAAIVLAVVLVSPLAAEDWPHWRGSFQNGVSLDRGLISSWSTSGENLLWRQDFIGRSTPLVLNGRVFVQGRGGEGKTRRELVAAFDAASGAPLWEHTLPAHLTTVPYNRAGWASLAADRETGTLYSQAVGGQLVALTQDGKVVWQKSLYEELGRFSGYGGRTHTPLVDEGQLIVSIINSSWGELGPPRHRYYAFDKRTGDVLWTSTPGGTAYDLNTTSNGVVAVIGGQRLFIAGNADGHIYALKARTGELVWSFELSKRGINSSPVVDGDVVFVGHSEENIDEATLGRTVAIDATGSGNVTGSHELWRRDVGMGFASPMVQGGRVYVMDNSANLYALNAKTGDTLWEQSIGTVGKSAPVWADGKIYVTEVNGHFLILEPKEDSVVVLDKEQVQMPDGSRYAEIYGSPAIAYGRIYFTTEEALYSLGDPSREMQVTATSEPPFAAEGEGTGKPAVLQLVPGDVTLRRGDQVALEARAFDEAGHPLGAVDAELSLQGLSGKLSNGTLVTGSTGGSEAGHVMARLGDLEAKARVRVFPDLPLVEDFESVQGRGRPYWLGAGRYQVTELEGQGKVLEKPVAEAGLLRSKLFIGPDFLGSYTIEADVQGNQKGRRRTDVGVINSGYILDLLGNSQKLQIRSWTAVLRMAETIPFEWEMGAWYRMKLRVDQQTAADGSAMALVRGKVWLRGEAEPDEWTITAEDPLPVANGAPGLLAYSPASAYFDNVTITANSK